jgi:hypothetical protein
MAVKKNRLGKVQKDVNGYKVRQMGTFVKLNNSEKTYFQHNGTFGVYAGRKKLVKNGFKSIDEAVNYILEL